MKFAKGLVIVGFVAVSFFLTVIMLLLEGYLGSSSLIQPEMFLYYAMYLGYFWSVVMFVKQDKPYVLIVLNLVYFILYLIYLQPEAELMIVAGIIIAHFVVTQIVVNYQAYLIHKQKQVE